MLTKKSFNSWLFLKDGFAKSIFIVLGSNIAIRTLDFVTNAAFARLLGPKELGFFSLTFIVYSVIGPIVMLGAPAILIRYSNRYLSSGYLFPFLRKVYIIPLTLATIMALLLYLKAGNIATYIYGSSQYNELIKIFAINLLPLSFFSLLLCTFQGLQSFRAKMFATAFYSLMFSVIGLTFVLVSSTARHLLIGNLLANIFTILIIGYIFFSFLVKNRSKKDKPLEENIYSMIFRFGIWFVFSEISFNTLGFFSRWALNRIMSAKEVGVYATGLTFAGLLFLGVRLLNEVLMPKFSELKDSNKETQLNFYFFLLIKVSMIVFLILCGLICMFSSKIIPIIYGVNYDDISSFISVIFIAKSYELIHYFNVTYSLSKEKSFHIFTSVFSGVLINVPLNYLLIPQFGMKGAAIATAASLFITSVILSVVNYHRNGFSHGIRYILIFLLPLGLFLDQHQIYYILALLFFSLILFEHDERDNIKKILSNLGKSILSRI